VAEPEAEPEASPAPAKGKGKGKRKASEAGQASEPPTCPPNKEMEGITVCVQGRFSVSRKVAALIARVRPLFVRQNPSRPTRMPGPCQQD
jgi:hypothetical protein